MLKKPAPIAQRAERRRRNSEVAGSKPARSSNEKKPPVKQVKNRTAKGTFEKGESGNPAGRPPSGQALSEAIREIGAERFPGGKTTYNEILARALWTQAITGDTRASSIVLDRMEGKVALPLTGKDGGPIETQHTVIEVPLDE